MSPAEVPDKLTSSHCAKPVKLTVPVGAGSEP